MKILLINLPKYLGQLLGVDTSVTIAYFLSVIIPDMLIHPSRVDKSYRVIAEVE